MATERRPALADVAEVRKDIATVGNAPTAVGPAGHMSVSVSSSSAAADSLLLVLWRSRWIMLLCLSTALAGGVAYIRTATPIYVSTAKLYLEYGGLRISNPYESGGRPQTDRYLSTQAELITSMPILGPVAEALASRRLRTFEDVDGPKAYLRQNIAVDVGKRDEIISISLGSAYPVEGAEIVNRLVDAYLTSRSQREQKDSAQVLKVLQEELLRVGRELDEKRGQLTNFQTHDMPLALGSDQGSGVMQRYLEFQNAYTRAQIQTMNAEAFLTAVRKLSHDPIALRQYAQLRGSISAYGGAEQEKTALEARITELELQKESLRDMFTEDHPKVVGLKTDVARMEAKLVALDDRFVKAVILAAEQQYTEAKSYEEQIAQSYNQQQEEVVLLNGEVAQYQTLRSAVDQLTGYYQTLEQQVREVRKIVGEDVGQLRMTILEPALPAPTPSEPQKGRIMAMASVLGLLLGGGIAVARAWQDQTLRSTDEIAAALRTPVLGAVPAMSRRQRIQERGRKVLLQPDSPEAEAFRTIRTAVFFGAPMDSAKSILVTSPATGDGKSTVVSNLAIAMARAGQKTLILDADLRKPVQHVIFELDHRERCLRNVFAGTVRLAAAVQPTGIEGLHILTCGQSISNPAEVLNSEQFARLLACLAEAYDRIVVDAPPVAIVADAQILGALCDATILVLKADKSVRKVAMHAVDALQSVGAHLLGVVVNEVRKHGDRYSYYHDRYRGHHSSRPREGAAGHPKKSIMAGAESRALSVKMVSKET
jgi:capsular exopolysaccharide synthesis family protein